MIVFTYNYVYFGLILIIYRKFSFGLQCYECDGIIFNYTITIDNLPSPTSSGCEIVTAENSCSARIGWFDDGKSEMYYSVDSTLPTDSVVIKTERKVTTWSGDYVTAKYLSYNCKPSNDMPCNTVQKLRLALMSTVWPTSEQIEKFDALIVPTTDFYGSSCLQLSNMTNCPATNIASCQHCMGIAEYSTHLNICTMCPPSKALTNFFDDEVTYFLQNRTRTDKIVLACRKHGGCNSIENIERIKNTLVTKFDFDQFIQSSAWTVKASFIIFFIIIFLHLILQ